MYLKNSNSLYALTFFVIVAVFWTRCLVKSHTLSDNQNPNNTIRYQIGALDWTHVELPYKISLWILLACIAKVFFNLSKRFASIFPDTGLLIVLGVIVGLILLHSHTDKRIFKLDSEIFFLFLLPPIIFEAGYSMPNRTFFDQLGSILTFAIIGTLFNALTIGISLWAIGLAGIYSAPTPILHIFLFTSLISATDPVTVLAVFEEIHVNQVLFILVFGESLLNDAIAVVLYHMFEGFSQIGPENILSIDIISGIVSFFVLGLGGVVIGLLWAAVISFTTRWTKHVQVFEPLFIFVMAYCSYLTAEFFHCSGILAIAFTGIAVRQYAEANISDKSKATVKYFLKTLSSSTETVIFMFMGLSAVSSLHHWDMTFIGFTVLFCCIYRAVGTVVLTFFLNKFRINRFDKKDQLIMSYVGLRGPIAYGLVMALPDDIIPAKEMFVTACFVVIYFTVFLQGMTIKPLLNFLKVKREEKSEKTLNEQIFNRNIHYIMVGIESIAGGFGQNSLRNKYETWNTKYLKPLLIREHRKTYNTKIVETFNMLNIRDMINRLGTLECSPSTTVPINVPTTGVQSVSSLFSTDRTQISASNSGTNIHSFENSENSNQNFECEQKNSSEQEPLQQSKFLLSIAVEYGSSSLEENRIQTTQF